MVCLDFNAVLANPSGTFASRFFDSLLRPFRGDALIRRKFSNGDTVLEQLVKLFQRPALHLWKEKVEENCMQAKLSASVYGQLGLLAGLPNVARFEPAHM